MNKDTSRIANEELWNEIHDCLPQVNGFQPNPDSQRNELPCTKVTWEWLPQ